MHVFKVRAHRGILGNKGLKLPAALLDLHPRGFIHRPQVLTLQSAADAKAVCQPHRTFKEHQKRPAPPHGARTV